MIKNLGKLDRMIRFLLGLLVAYLYFTDRISGTWAIVLGIFALILIITSFISFCPIYYGLGIRTNKKEEKK